MIKAIQFQSNKKYLYPVCFMVGWLLFFVPGFYYSYLDNRVFLNQFIEFYPLLFLPFFISKCKKQFKPVDFLITLLLAAFFVINRLDNNPRIYGIFQIFLALYLLKAVGIKVHFFGYLLFIMVPHFTDKYNLLFGFYLRLFLSRIAGVVLTLFDPAVSVSGNVIVFKNQLFSIDPPCQGLRMLIGMLLVLFIFLKKITVSGFSRIGKIPGVLLFMVCAFSLWLAANLARIVVLIYFGIPASSIYHELTGAFLFIVCIIAPLFYLYRNFFQKGNGRNVGKDEQEMSQIPGQLNQKRSHMFRHLRKKVSHMFLFLNKRMLFPAFILGLMLLISLFMPEAVQKDNSAAPYRIGPFYLDGMYKNEMMSRGDIVTYTCGESNLIVKRNFKPVGFLHHPRHCWIGEGYSMSNEKVRNIKGFGKVKEALVTRGNLSYRLYWWYQPLGARAGKTFAAEPAWRLFALFNRKDFIQVNLFVASYEDSDELFRKLSDSRLANLF